MKDSKLEKIILLLGLAVVCVTLYVALAQKLILPTLDLGRHLKNGEVILRDGLRSSVLTTNFYTYTHPEQAFTNHHWLSGVVMYLIFQVWGYTGLHLVYIVLMMLCLLVAFDLVRRYSSMKMAVLCAACMVSFLAVRLEVRPEIVSFVLCSVFLWLSVRIYRREVLTQWKYICVPLMLMWVNMHIGFVFGFLVLGVYAIAEIVREPTWSRTRAELSVVLLCLVVSLVNPFGYRALLEPFMIFRNYGYTVVENQSVFFLERLSMNDVGPFILLRVITVVSVGVCVLGCLR